MIVAGTRTTDRQKRLLTRSISFDTITFYCVFVVLRKQRSGHVYCDTDTGSLRTITDRS